MVVDSGQCCADAEGDEALGRLSLRTSSKWDVERGASKRCGPCLRAWEGRPFHLERVELLF